nr:hypothetical protein [Tanacetum cinerariifolium]
MLRLPNIFLSASTLSSLTIAERELPSSLMVNVLNFKSLKLLSLSRVPIHEDVIESLTTSCPLLEEIYLGYCYGFTTFCVYRHNILQKVEIFYDDESVDTLWFQKLRRFLDKSNRFKVLKLFVKHGIKSPPYELEHVKLVVRNIQLSSRSPPPILDAVLWCCRPRSTLSLTIYSDKCHVVQNTYETLLQQENKSRTNIRFVLSNFGKCEQHFNDLKLVLKALSLDERISRIAFIKEEVVHEAG